MHRAPEPRRPVWDRIGEIVSGRFSWVPAVAVALLGGLDAFTEALRDDWNRAQLEAAAAPDG